MDVFAASAVVDAEAALSGTRLRVTGTVSDVDLASGTSRRRPDEEVDAPGPGRAGARVHLRIVEHWSVQRQTGTRYDRIDKKVVPVYKTVDKQRTVLDRVRHRRPATGPTRWRFDVVGGKRSYEITASYVDEQYADDADDHLGQRGQRTRRTTRRTTDGGTQLVNADSHADTDGEYDGLYRVGDTVRVRFTGGTASPSVQRYLYAIAQRGLRYVTVGDTPTFRSTFDESWLPGAWITGVRFTGDGYETAVSDYWPPRTSRTGRCR